MRPRRRARLCRRLMLLSAALPMCQFFSGCFPNIPGVPNVSGAVLFEVQNLINRVLFDTFSILVANVLNL